MGQTQYYNLVFFDFGDQLDSALSVQKEIDRFVVIDRQLYGLYNVFGNGVLEGWNIRDNGYTEQAGISVSVSSGLGIIQYIASQTTTPVPVNQLPPNSLVYIYALLRGNTVRDRIVSFQASRVRIDDEFALLLGTVATGNNSVLAIDNTGKELIGFQQFIKNEIDNHKHRGIPTKIDLQEEVKNQLPGARISGIDASKIISGTLDAERMPVLDHEDLENKGILTHAALDSFVKTFSQSNKELLGEVATVNLLKTVIFFKYFHPDVDEHFINELIIIPGISPNNFIDFENSNCIIDLDTQCLGGQPAKVGIFQSVYWEDQTSFLNYYYKNKIEIEHDQLALDRSLTKRETIENFEGGPLQTPGTTIPGFTKQIILQEDNINLVSDGSDANKIEGNYGGRFSGDVTPIYVFTKEFSPRRNWNEDYDEIVFYAKTLSSQHGRVSFNLRRWDETEQRLVDVRTSPWIILERNYVTSSDNNNFEEFAFDISGYNVDEIQQLVIYTEDIVDFVMDDIHVRRRNLYEPSGTIRFRHTTGSRVNFQSIFYNAEIPEGTSLSIRVKVASTDELLPRAAYTLPLLSGNIFAIDGTAAEIEVVMTANESQTLSPSLSSLELRFLVDADFTGFFLDDQDDWERGELVNAEMDNSFSTNNTNIVLSPPINIMGKSFIYKDAISEIDDENVGIFGFTGNKMPISPRQAKNWNAKPYRKFNYLTSADRQYSKNFILADTHNDRVIETNKNGDFVRGFGSVYVSDDTFYPMCSVYNPRKRQLSFAMSKSAVLQDITKVHLYIGSVAVQLTSDDTILSTNKGNGQVIEISLSNDVVNKLAGVTSGLTLFFAAEAFTQEIEFSSTASKLSGIYGINCFIGDFTYVNNIRHPIFVEKLENENWIIGNSSVFYDPDAEVGSDNNDNVTETSMLEIDEDGNEIFTNNDVQFSDFSLGSIRELPTGQLLVAGIVDSETTITQSVTGADIVSQHTDSEGNISERNKFRALAVDKHAEKRGVIAQIDKVNNRFFQFYISPDGLYPSDVDIYDNGEIVASESSFLENNGRIIKLDSFGNIIWMYGMGVFNVIHNSQAISADGVLLSL